MRDLEVTPKYKHGYKNASRHTSTLVEHVSIIATIDNTVEQIHTYQTITSNFLPRELQFIMSRPRWIWRSKKKEASLPGHIYEPFCFHGQWSQCAKTGHQRCAMGPISKKTRHEYVMTDRLNEARNSYRLPSPD